MERVSVLAASTRRALVGIGVAALIAVASGTGVAAQTQQTPPPPQTPPAQQPAAPAKPQEQVDQLKFNQDTPVLLMNQVAPDKTAEFESAWASIRAGLAKLSDKPDIKAFGDTLQKIYKVDLGGLTPGEAPKVVLYIIQLDTPSKTHSYNPVKIIYDTLMAATVITREEADVIYKKLQSSVQNIQFWPLTRVGR
jgi:hypothetical protein